MGEPAKAPSSPEEGVGGGGVSSDTLRHRARLMRNNPTEPERRLWHALKGRQMEGWKFRRQHVIGQRIVDFYCPAAKLAIEVDGDTHDPEYDRARDAWLGLNVELCTVRFTNQDVMKNLDGVLMHLHEVLVASNHPPTPSLSKEGE